ncbi:MAG: hypothetical protein KGI71_06165 [Patescibacteria group bacterium]|nr:hypothetical protein [Patescibacteria group bacterium]
MRQDKPRECSLCLIEHSSPEEAEAIHDATDSIHEWLSDRIVLFLSEPKVPKGKLRQGRSPAEESKLPTTPKPSDVARRGANNHG